MNPTREEWLVAAVEDLRRQVFQPAPVAAIVPYNVRVTCSWPGGGSRQKRIGECWAQSASRDGTHEIMISPVLADAVEVLAVLAHELVHAVVGVQHGHKAPFKRLARAIGLAGKLTATVAGPELRAKLAKIAGVHGPYPHAAIDPRNRKKQTTRMIKCECGECGYVCRTTRQWLDQAGAPICPACEVQMIAGGGAGADGGAEERLAAVTG